MTYQEIFDNSTQLIGQALGTDDFNRLLLHVQRKLENKREWVMLKGRDTSLSLTPADYNGGNLTAKTLPASVLASLEFLADRPVVLIDAAGNEYELGQIPIEARQSYYNVFGKYFIDYFNGTIYFTGQASQNYTIGLNFKQVPTAISATQAWIFPSRFHSLLPYGIAAIHKRGIDYDFINASQSAQGQDAEYLEIWQDMFMWDAKMQADSLKGLDRSVNQDGGVWTTGRINTQ